MKERGAAYRAGRAAERHSVAPAEGDLAVARPLDGASIGLPRLGARRSGGSLHPHPVIRWAFAVFVFSIPFESGIGFGQAVSISKLLGITFFAVALLQARVCFRRPPAIFWCFALYVAALALTGMYQNPLYAFDIVKKILMLSQMLMLFWVSCNLLQSERVVRLAFGSLTAACTLLSALQLLGVTTADVAETQRVSAMGEDPNTVAAVLVIGLLAIVGQVYAKPAVRTTRRWLVWITLAVIALPLIRTGSRGALIALGAGLAVLLLRRGGITIKIRALRAMAAMAAVLVVLTLRSEVSVRRWEGTIEQGSLASRERIFPAAWEMFLDKPILGWGPVANYYELGRRVGSLTKDTHNVVLLVLTEVGILGALPWFLGIIGCCVAAWRARRGAQGIFPLVLLVGVLVVNMSLSWQNRKLHWLVLSFPVASALAMKQRKREPLPAEAGWRGSLRATG